MQNTEPILLIMAAGMGSRYGGLKQMDPIGPAGEVILHYSIYDARRAGFKRVVFLIKHEIEADFKRLVGDPVARHMEVRYAFQELDKLPAPYTVPEGRKKPWGTGHAVLCCADLLDAPFAAINADDYYGPAAFRTAYDFLKNARDDEKARWMMVGYHLCNTTTENGHVSRGVCSADADGFLTDIVERTHIVQSSDGPLYTEDGETYHLLPADTLVSMNLWGFTGSFLDALRKAFPVFLRDEVPANPLKAEIYLPTVVNQEIEAGRATVRVLESADKWYGVTYQADRPQVVEAIRRMTDSGLYPVRLWE